jgi:predicted GIY-YIG superfamily endonuclease
MKQYHVYELFDQSGTIVYVGQSIDPKSRFYMHTKVKLGPGKGTFYNRTDLDWRIIQTYNNKKDALISEGVRKLELGFEWSERTKTGSYEGRSKGGKTGEGGKIGGKAAMSIEYICTYCLKTIKGTNYFRYHGPKCKLSPSHQDSLV